MLETGNQRAWVHAVIDVCKTAGFGSQPEQISKSSRNAVDSVDSVDN